MRAIGISEVVKIEFPSFELGAPDPAAAVVDQHPVYFDGNFIATNIYDRALLAAGHRIPGPAVILQTDSTTVIHPGHLGEVDTHLNILIRPEGATRQ